MEDNKVYKELRKNIEILDADYRNDKVLKEWKESREYNDKK